MHLSHKQFVLVIIVTVLLAGVLFVKFFTAVVYHDGDPTVALVIKSNFSLTNSHQLTHDKNLTDYIVLALDENEFVGQYSYTIFTDWLWMVVLLLSIMYLVRLSTY